MTPALVEVVAMALRTNPATIDDSSALEAIDGWDSLQSVVLMNLLEQTFLVRLDPAEFAGAATIADLRAILVRKGVPGV